MTSKIERRRHERTERDIEAKSELSDRLAIACRVKDLSLSGFRLVIAETIYLPEQFDLLLPMIPEAE